MTTKALDLVTIFKCFRQLEEKLLGMEMRSLSGNYETTQLFIWYEHFRSLVEKITGLKAMSSNDADALNNFLTVDGFDPMFYELGKSDVGVVSILDKMVKWLKGEAELTDISSGLKRYSGFEISPSGVDIYEVPSGILAELKTTSDDYLWLSLPKDNVEIEFNGLDMFDFAFKTMARERISSGRYAGAQIPKIDFDVKPDLNFLLGAGTIDKNGNPWNISQAFQQFKFRMDETGARVKVATGMAMMLGCSINTPVKLVFNRPFFGWWTQKGLEELPMAVFYADYDCWKNPAGSLESL